jgi:glycosyltransferase involved in cell wall biosynthesis
MALGTPIIATSHGGIAETLIHGENGLLAPERDATALASHVAALAAAPQLREALRVRARSTAEATFDIAKINSRLLDLINAN